MPTHAESTQATKVKSAASETSGKQDLTNSPYQFADKRPEAILQRKLGEIANGNTVQKKENNTGLPDQLKSGVENLSGHSLDDVRVHYNSGRPAQLQAHAYAQGTDIHVAPGQEKHLPHEAWHVVQQKQGRVKPTVQLKAGVNVNDDTGLEKEADVMGTRSLHVGSNPSFKPLQKKADLSTTKEQPIQASMATLHGQQNNRYKEAHKVGYTTVGFEVDLLTTNSGNPLQGMSHLVVGKSGPPFENQPLGYQLETDAGNILELVSPPYLIQKDHRGVLNAEDLKNAVKELKDGYDKAQDAKDAVKPSGKANINTELATIVDTVSTSFNANLAPVNVQVFEPDTGMDKEGDGVVNETHMSPNANLDTLNKSLSGDNNKHIYAEAGPGFNPQINIFTSVENYDALAESTASRLDELNKFNFKEPKEITEAKDQLIIRLKEELHQDDYSTSINHLEQTIKVLHPRRKALEKQIAGQNEMFESETPLNGGKKAEFEKAASDVSFVKDQKGVWLKTDVYNYTVKSLKRDKTKINLFGSTLWNLIQELKLFDKENLDWVNGLLFLSVDLKLFSEVRQRTNKGLEEGWGGTTFFTGKDVLGMRHDTMLKEKKVKQCFEMLNGEGTYSTDDDHVLIELRNMGFQKGDSLSDINHKLDDFLQAWNTKLDE